MGMQFAGLNTSLRNARPCKSTVRFSIVYCKVASLVAQMVKRLSAMWETWAQSLGWEDPLEKELATHSSILAWKSPRTEGPGRLQSMESPRVGHN